MNKSLSILAPSSFLRKAAASGRRSKAAAILFASGTTLLFVACFMLLAGSSALPSPVEASSKTNRAAGAALYRDKGCMHCHGRDATGTDQGPDLSTVGKRWNRQRIQQQILNGGGGMPPFAEALQPDEVKFLTDFLKAKRKADKSSPAAAPQKPATDDSGL
jgi:mono/diheme cytochrome c family protein